MTERKILPFEPQAVVERKPCLIEQRFIPTYVWNTGAVWSIIKPLLRFIPTYVGNTGFGLWRRTA